MSATYEVLGYELETRIQRTDRFESTGRRFATREEAIAAGEEARSNIYPEYRHEYYRVLEIRSNRLLPRDAEANLTNIVESGKRFSPPED
jgi:hypothetical protein